MAERRLAVSQRGQTAVLQQAALPKVLTAVKRLAELSKVLMVALQLAAL
jgi:hypothetical protein